MSSKHLARAFVASCAALAATATIGASAIASTPQDPVHGAFEQRLAQTQAAPEKSAIAANAITSGRIYGADRYETAAKLSAEWFDAGPDVAYIASGADFADALSAAPAAAWLGGPLLLVKPNEVPTVVLNELKRLAPKSIVVVGGPHAVSNAVYNKLAALTSSIRRDDGIDRYETSRIVTERAFSNAGPVEGVFLATGRDFPDALSAASAAGVLGVPVVLVNGEKTIIDPAIIALFKRIGIEGAAIAGGPGAVTPALEGALAKYGFDTIRYAGTDRYDTSFKINNDPAVISAFKAGGDVPEGIFATGSTYADAMAGAALAGQLGDPLWVVPSNCVPANVLGTGSRLGISNYILLGGPMVLSNNVQALKSCS